MAEKPMSITIFLIMRATTDGERITHKVERKGNLRMHVSKIKKQNKKQKCRFIAGGCIPVSVLYVADVVRRLIRHACLQAVGA